MEKYRAVISNSATDWTGTWYVVDEHNNHISKHSPRQAAEKEAERLNKMEDAAMTENKVNVNDLKNDLDTGDYGDQLNDYRYSESYVCDAISEIADSNTSIYYSDIEKFISDNVEDVNDTISEYGWDGCGSDLMKAGQMAEYRSIEQDVYKHLGDALKLCAYDFLLHDLHFEEIPEELDELITELAEEEDHNERMNAIPDAIREWLGENNGGINL